MTDAAFQWARDRIPGDEPVEITPLRAEASFRAFYRLEAPGRSLVLMISPPDREQNGQFERLAGVFGAAGLPVPGIIDAKRQSGWYLMTDLGHRELGDAYGGPSEQAGLEAALQALITLQTVTDPAIPPYTAQRLRDELGIFTEWFAGGLLETSLPPDIEPVFEDLVARMSAQLQCCVHRDYHCRNLLFDPDTDRLGIVDFQDALVGPVTYDPASLLYDCYHRFSDGDVAYWLAWYLDRTPFELDPDAFATDVAMTAIQRQLKAVGIFARLQLRDGRSTHLRHILPVLDSLTDLTRREGATAPLADWLRTLDSHEVARRIERARQRAPMLA